MTEVRGQSRAWTRRHSAVATVLCSLLFALTSPARADITVNYGFITNANIPDGSGQYTTSHVLGGISSYSNVTVGMNLTTQTPGNPMFLGDMYSSLTYGLPREFYRTAVLLNRPGRDIAHPFGSSISSFNVTLADSAAHNVFDAGTYYPGENTFQSDGRSGTNPYGAAENFGTHPRDATLTDLNGAELGSKKFTLLVADTSAGGLATLSDWHLNVTGTAAGSGTLGFVGSDSGTFSITDDGGTNTLGANVVTTQVPGGGPLNITATGTLIISGNVSGTSGLTKAGAGTLTLSGTNTYSGATAVNAGKLFINGDSSGATGTVTVNNSGSVLGGTGTVGGNVTLGSNAILRGGTGAAASGTLTLAGSVTMQSNSIIQLALGATTFAHSTLAANGSLSFASMQTFSFLDFGAQTITYQDIITNVGDPGAGISAWTIANSGWTGSFFWDGANIDLTLTAVPEPSTWFAAALALSGVVFTQRRRFMRKEFNRPQAGGYSNN